MNLTEQQFSYIIISILGVLLLFSFIQMILYSRLKKRQMLLLDKDMSTNFLGHADISNFSEQIKKMDEKLGYLDDTTSTIMFQLDESAKKLDKELASLKQSIDFKKHLKKSNIEIEEAQLKEGVMLKPKDVLRDLTPNKEVPTSSLNEELGMNKSTIYNIYGNKYDSLEDTKVIKKEVKTEEQKIIDYFKNLNDLSDKIDQNMKSNMNQDDLAKTMNVSKGELDFVKSFNKLRGGE